jgi:hypothetical protein
MILKRVKRNFITIMPLRTTSLVVIGAFLFSPPLVWARADLLRPVAAGEREPAVIKSKLILLTEFLCYPKVWTGKV